MGRIYPSRFLIPFRTPRGVVLASRSPSEHRSASPASSRSVHPVGEEFLRVTVVEPRRDSRPADSVGRDSRGTALCHLPLLRRFTGKLGSRSWGHVLLRVRARFGVSLCSLNRLTGWWSRRMTAQSDTRRAGIRSICPNPFYRQHPL